MKFQRQFALRDLFGLLLLAAIYLGLIRFIGDRAPALTFMARFRLATGLLVGCLHTVFFAWAWIRRPVAEAIADEHQAMRREVYRTAITCALPPFMIVLSSAWIVLMRYRVPFNLSGAFLLVLASLILIASYVLLIRLAFSLWGTRKFGCPTSEDRALWALRWSTWLSYGNLLAAAIF